MSIEIEKKYLLTTGQFEQVFNTLAGIEAEFIGENFEENIIYGGGILSEQDAVLRVRKIKDKTFLTFKQRFKKESEIKRQIEYETEIENAVQIEKIIESLGFAKTLVYEKRRKIWRFRDNEVVLDELPFGLFMEIEGSVEAIKEAELLLGADKFKAELQTYPQLTASFGVEKNNVTESRFI